MGTRQQNIKGAREVAVERPLVTALEAYGRRGKARWHTPGHKGGRGMRALGWEWDLTEVADLTPKTSREDPVHRSEQLMAETFGAQRTWYSVQGATLPVMAAVLASCRPGSRVLVDRQAHRSVLSGIIIAGASPVWAYPRLGPGGYPLPVDDEDRAEMIRRQDPQAVIVTNPTYDGLSAPLAATSRLCQERGIPLIVDEAHGTHFYGNPGFPLSALDQGADLVCHGAHKTEAVLTQTGLLHQNSRLVSAQQLQQAWEMLATSSPSYLLMASLDELQALRHTPDYRDQWVRFGRDMQEIWRDLETAGIFVLQGWWQRSGGWADPAKLTLVGNGERILSELRPFGEPEKADPFGVTLVLTPADDLGVLRQALRTLGGAGGLAAPMAMWPQAVPVWPPGEAVRRPREWVPWREAAGRVAAAPVTLYPPGVPVIVSGERIDAGMVSWLESTRDWCRQRTGELQGFEPAPEGTLWKEGEEGLWVTTEFEER